MSNHRDAKWLRQQYESGKTIVELASTCGVATSTIFYQMQKRGIETRLRSPVLIEGDHKRCNACNDVKPLTEFYRKKNSVDGYWHQCRTCFATRKQATDLAYRQRPEVKARTLATGNAWRESNRDRSNELTRARVAKVKHTLGYRIPNAMGTMVHQALKTRKEGRSWRVWVGYGLTELVEHLETKFEPWMTWGNWGLLCPSVERRWQIDHIRPVCSFDFDVNDPMPVVRECWALSNLRPLCALMNLQKGGR